MRASSGLTELIASSLKDFGLKIDESMLRIKARMLEPPTLVFGRGEKIMPRDGGWSMMRASN